MTIQRFDVLSQCKLLLCDTYRVCGVEKRPKTDKLNRASNCSEVVLRIGAACLVNMTGGLHIDDI